MGVTMFVTLYSTRLVLSALGESDFGIFHLVGGIISMLGFLNLAAANATYRFLAYADSSKDLEVQKKVFNISLVLHCFIALATIIVLLIAMYPLFNGILNILPERVFTTKFIYASLIFCSAITIINVPYDALLNVHENMLYYSLMGIFEALLRLGIAFMCVYTDYSDKLFYFGILSAFVPVITLTISKIYCHRHYEECIISPVKYWDYQYAKKIASFSGWSFLTSISELFTFQGNAVILNHFFGTRLNAAQGVSNQVRAYLSTFAENMKKALNPVIMKKAGTGELAVMNAISLSGCKFSVLMTLLFSIPFILEAPYILSLWLINVPQWTVTFCIFQLVNTIGTQMTYPLAISIYGMGDIKWFAIWKSIINISPLITTYICFYYGGGPIWLYIPMVVLWTVCGNIVILLYSKKICGLKIRQYIKSVMMPVLTITFIMFAFGSCVCMLMEEGFPRLLSCFTATTIGLMLSTYLIGLSTEERKTIHDFATNTISKIKRK